jgi:gluconokinase
MILVLMGVSGSGKTTVGRLLSQEMGWPFYDGDDFHPPENVAKMARGIPLDDDDRVGWLDQLAATIQQHLDAGQSMLLACSALKHKYRDRLRIDPQQVRFIYLKGDFELILSRMQTRDDHYMRPTMLASQFADLEEPQDALVLDIDEPPEQLCQRIIQTLLSR